MKKWFVLFLCLFFICTANAEMRVLSPFIPADACTYDICQNFEGTGYDNSETWNETVGDGTIDEDYAVSPLVGSQSLRMVDGGADSSVTTTFSDHGTGSTTWVYFTFKVLVDIDSDDYIFELEDDAANAGSLIFRTDGTLRWYHGGAPCAGTTDVSGGGQFHIWLYWKSETGTSVNGEFGMYIESSGTRGAVECSETDGDANREGINTLIFHAQGGSVDWVLDKVLVDDADMGNQ